MAGAVRQELKRQAMLGRTSPVQRLNGRGCPSGIETLTIICDSSAQLGWLNGRGCPSGIETYDRSVESNPTSEAEWQGLSVRN